MAFPGWLTFAGNEIINIDRTLKYARQIVPTLDVQAPDWCDMSTLLKQAEYTTPANDNAPWYDPGVPDSHGFIGLYPLDVSGLDNDTRDAVVVEGSFDGGFISTPRRKTREVRVTGLLIGEDQGCCDYGLFWLKAILDANVRSVQRGRPDPATAETMASIPDICGSERGDIGFLAACPELGCGSHCGHNASGADKAHDVPLTSLQPTSGTFKQVVGGDWVFTPADGTSELRTPLLPDDQTCPVRYVWDLEGLPGALVTGYGVRDGRLVYGSEPSDQYTRTNLATNPQWKTSAGTAVVRVNLAVNPAMRALATATVAVTNRVANPRAGTDTNGYVISSGSGTSALTRVTTGGPLANCPTYLQQKWSAAATALRSYTGYGSLTAGVYKTAVVTGERLYASTYFRTSVVGQTFQMQIDWYSSFDTLIGTSIVSPDMSPAANVWTKAELSTVVPSGAVTVRVLIVHTAGPLFPINAILSTSAWMIVRDQHATPYFDGAASQRGGQKFAWLGTAHASASTASGFENVARTNTVPNPELGTDLTGWSANDGAGTATLARVTNPGLSVLGNVIPAFARMKYTAGGAAAGTAIIVGDVVNGQTAYPVVVQAGQPTTFSAYVRSNVFDRTVSLVVSYYGGGVVKIPASVSLPDTHGPEYGVGTAVGAWQRVWVTATPPVGADHAVVRAYVNGGADWKVNDYLDVTAVMVEMTDRLSEFFDGSTPSTGDVDYSWGGVTGVSQSFARNRISGAEVVARTNYALNPTMYAEGGPTGSGAWSGIIYGIGAGSGTRVPVDVISPAVQGRALTSRSVNPSSPIACGVIITGMNSLSLSAQAAVPNEPWTFSVDVTPDNDAAVTATLQWLNSGGTGNGTVAGPVNQIVAAGVPLRVSVGGTAPAGTAAVYLGVTVRSADLTSNAFFNVAFDNLLIEKIVGQRTFFSGDAVGPSLSGLDPIWEGMPGNSRSLAIGGQINTTLAGSGVAFWQSTGNTPSGGMSGSVFARAVSSGGIGSYSAEVLADAPLAYYKLDEGTGTAVDSSGNGRNGTYNGTAGVPGVVGQAMDTGGCRVDIADAAWNSFTAAFSIEAWHKPNGTDGYIVEKYEAPSKNGYALRIVSGKVLVYSMATGAVLITAPSAPTSGVWHQYVFTHDGTNGRIYQDGVLVTGPTTMALPADGVTGVRIGGRGDDGSMAAIGPIDEVSFYNGALSAARIMVHYTAATTVSTSNVLIVGQPDTLASPGNYYSGSFQIRQIAGTPDPANTVTVDAYFYDSGGNAIGTVSAISVVNPIVTNDWQKVNLTSALVAPAGTVSLRLRIARSGTWDDVNARIEVGDIIWERVGALGAPAGSFFDGTTLDTVDFDYKWQTTPDASVALAVAVVPVSGGVSVVPPAYRSSSHSVTGYSVVLPGPGAYIEPVHGAEPGMNGLVAGQPAVIAFDVYKQTGLLSVRLYFDTGTGADFIETLITAPLPSRVTVSSTVPTGSVTAYWRIIDVSGDEAYISRVVIEAPIDVSGDFFDGSTPPAVWTGPADASASVLTPPPTTVYLPSGMYRDGQPSFATITSESAITVNRVTAYYYEPVSVDSAYLHYQRILKSATCTAGPEVTQEYKARNAVMKKVEFTIVCPDPWAYGTPIRVATVVNGSATAVASGVTVQSYTPGATELTCYAEDVAYIPMDPNCGTIPRPPRPDPVGPCSASSVNRGLLFFIPPSRLEERAATLPTLTFNKQSFNRDLFVVRCWPLPFAGATLEDISACDTRGWLWVGDIAADRGFILDCAKRRGTLTDVPVTGGTLSLEATHFIYPPKSVPFNPANDYDLIPLTWPEMYGGNDGYFILVEYNGSAGLSMTLDLVTRR